MNCTHKFGFRHVNHTLIWSIVLKQSTYPMGDSHCYRLWRANASLVK